MEFYYDEVQGEVLVIKADGGLNAQTADEFVTSIEKLVDAGLRKIIVDCSRLDHVSSYGLGVLVRLHSRMAANNGDVKIAGARGLLIDVMRLTRLNSLFEFYPDVPRARLAFRPKHASDQESGIATGRRPGS